MFFKQSTSYHDVDEGCFRVASSRSKNYGVACYAEAQGSKASEAKNNLIKKIEAVLFTPRLKERRKLGPSFLFFKIKTKSKK